MASGSIVSVVGLRCQLSQKDGRFGAVGMLWRIVCVESTPFHIKFVPINSPGANDLASTEIALPKNTTIYDINANYSNIACKKIAIIKYVFTRNYATYKRNLIKVVVYSEFFSEYITNKASIFVRTPLCSININPNRVFFFCLEVKMAAAFCLMITAARKCVCCGRADMMLIIVVIGKSLLNERGQQICCLRREPFLFIGAYRFERCNSRLGLGGIWICNQFRSLLQLQCEIIRSQFVELVLGCLKVLLSSETPPYRKSNSNNSEEKKCEISRQLGSESSFFQTGLAVIYPTVEFNEYEPHGNQTKGNNRRYQCSIGRDCCFVFCHLLVVSRTASNHECHNHVSLTIYRMQVAA